MINYLRNLLGYDDLVTIIAKQNLRIMELESDNKQHKDDFEIMRIRLSKAESSDPDPQELNPRKQGWLDERRDLTARYAPPVPEKSVMITPKSNGN